MNHLFIASVPVLGALIALFLLRHWDRGTPGGRQVICRILTKRGEALQAAGLDLPVAVQSALHPWVRSCTLFDLPWVRSCTSGFDPARLPTLKGAAIRV